jgi:membrane protein DedA with SNARE-associated domain
VAERGRLDRVIGEADRELKELRKLTTSGIGSRWFGVPVLLPGVAFSTWPDSWAEVWPTWLSPLVLGLLLACAVTAWICWAILTRLRAEDPTTSP